jgi:hypothetical protein
VFAQGTTEEGEGEGGDELVLQFLIDLVRGGNYKAKEPLMQAEGEGEWRRWRWHGGGRVCWGAVPLCVCAYVVSGFLVLV